MDPKQFESIKNYAREQMDKVGLYGWPHVKRVYNLCMYISRFEKEKSVDLDDNTLDHGDVGAKKAKNFLKSCGFNKDKIKSVCHAIRFHTKIEKPASFEAKILHDADFIDKLGAVGIATVFVKACLTNRTIEEIAEMFGKETLEPSYIAKHILWLKERPHLYTKTGRKIASKRGKIVSSFFKQLEDEIELKDVLHDASIIKGMIWQ